MKLDNGSPQIGSAPRRFGPALALFALALTVRRGRAWNAGRLLIAFWSLCSLILVLLQRRFGEYAAPAVSTPGLPSA